MGKKVNKPVKTGLVIYHQDGRMVETPPDNGEYFTFQELQFLVEGMVEIVPLPSGKIMICNEEGKINGLPKNEKATEIWKKEYQIEKYRGNNDELVVGNAIFCDSSMVK